MSGYEPFSPHPTLIQGLFYIITNTHHMLADLSFLTSTRHQKLMKSVIASFPIGEPCFLMGDPVSRMGDLLF